MKGEEYVYCSVQNKLSCPVIFKNINVTVHASTVSLAVFMRFVSLFKELSISHVSRS